MLSLTLPTAAAPTPLLVVFCPFRVNPLVLDNELFRLGDYPCMIFSPVTETPLLPKVPPPFPKI
jgi:hypothetical protein